MGLDVDACQVSAFRYRHVSPGVNALSQRMPLGDGRWQRGKVVGGFYLADSEETMWAEWYRQLAEAGVPPKRGMPRDVCRVIVDLDRVANLSDEARLQRVGLAVPRPTRGEWPQYQRVGESLFNKEEYCAVLAPSAARPAEGHVLCVFRPDNQSVQGVELGRKPKRVVEPPAPPPGLRT